jgi:hypothetical protein
MRISGWLRWAGPPGNGVKGMVRGGCWFLWGK